MKGRPRHSLQRAEATGATKHNPARYKTRKPPTLPPLGRAPAHMSEAERRCWTAFKRELPWLTAADTCQVELACELRAYAQDRENPNAAKAIGPLRKAVALMGGTPADRPRVNMPVTAEADPADDFIN